MGSGSPGAGTTVQWCLNHNPLVSGPRVIVIREPISPPSAAETQAGCLDVAPGKPPSLPVPTRPWPVPGPLLRQPGCRPATPPAWLSWETGATSDVMRELTLETPAGGGDAGACSRRPGEGGSQRETQPGSQPVSPGAPGAGPKETPGCSPKSLAQEPALATYTCVCTRCPDPDLVLESLHDKQDGDPGRGPQWCPEHRSGNPSQAQAPRAPAAPTHLQCGVFLLPQGQKPPSRAGEGVWAFPPGTAAAQEPTGQQRVTVWSL